MTKIQKVDQLSSGEILKSELDKTNWRVFKVSEADMDESTFQYDSRMPPQDIAYLIEKKSTDLKVKFDAILCLEERLDRTRSKKSLIF
jgi:hypothetical protein